MNKLKKIFIIIFIALIVMISGFVYWAEFSLGVMDEAVTAMASTNSIEIENGTSLSFTNTENLTATGIILYPGGRVDAEAYAVLGKSIAETGIDVYIPHMPLNLAFFNTNGAQKIIEENPHITNWYVGGHSLGGAMACEYAKKNVANLKGLVLLASYPAKQTDLSQVSLKVVSISAENDGFASKAEIAESRKQLPQSAVFIEIKGGNHEQFGYYGHQKGDGEATITREKQTSLIAQSIIDFIRLGFS